jgi:putative sterol carrier protein
MLPLLAGVISTAQAQKPVMMSAEWAEQACAAWNANPVLTGELAESGWAKNDKGRGFKVMHVYRDDCVADSEKVKDSEKVEMRISLQDGKARCVYGGKIENKELTGADYLMYASTKRWQEMGAGEYGPMKAMMFGRLQFDGPRWEAMKNMGPLEQFLLLVGKVDASTDSCP